MEKRKSDTERERERERERAKMPTSAAILDRLHIIDRLRYPHTEQENIFQLLQQKTTHAHKDLAKKAKEKKKKYEKKKFVSVIFTHFSLLSI